MLTAKIEVDATVDLLPQTTTHARGAVALGRLFVIAKPHHEVKSVLMRMTVSGILGIHSTIVRAAYTLPAEHSGPMLILTDMRPTQ